LTCGKGSAGARILASGCHSTPVTSAEAWLYLASVQLLDEIGDYLILADQARRFLAAPRTISRAGRLQVAVISCGGQPSFTRASQPAREANQSQCEGRQPQPMTFQMAGVAVARQMFRETCSSSRGCSRVARVTGKPDRIRQTETAEVRLNQSGAAGSNASARSIARFGPSTAQRRDCPC
jgi:hypothetical protein